MIVQPSTTCAIHGCPARAVKGSRCADHATDAPPVDMTALGTDAAIAMGHTPQMADRLIWQAVIVGYIDADGDEYTDVIARQPGRIGPADYGHLATRLATLARHTAQLDEQPPAEVWLRPFTESDDD